MVVGVGGLEVYGFRGLEVYGFKNTIQVKTSRCGVFFCGNVSP